MGVGTPSRSRRAAHRAGGRRNLGGDADGPNGVTPASCPGCAVATLNRRDMPPAVASVITGTPYAPAWAPIPEGEPIHGRAGRPPRGGIVEIRGGDRGGRGWLKGGKDGVGRCGRGEGRSGRGRMSC